MTAVILCLSASGESTARRLALSSDEQVIRITQGTLARTVAEWWSRADALVFVSSLAVAVRASAPHLRDKATDPAVIVVTEDGKTVLPVTGVHLGGGRDMAGRLAERLGVVPLLTTSSDRAELTAPDLLASRWKWRLLGRENLPSTNRQLLETGKIRFWTDVPSCIPSLPVEYDPASSPEEAQVLLSPRKNSLRAGQVQLVSPCIVTGIGCRRNTSLETLRSVLFTALEKENLLPDSLAELRTIPEKTDEPGLRALAAELGIFLVSVDRETILSLGGEFSPSAAARHLHLPGVAEPCAASAGTLLGGRTAEKGVTVAFALLSRRPGGKLSILGTGPGDGDYLTLQGRKALEEADVVVGYRLYAELLPPRWLEGKIVETYSMGEEEKRVDRAVNLAEEGKKVVLLSGGDPVLFGLAGLALRKARGRVPATALPGITAAQAAGTLLGAPYVNGFILLSLSDYLQPWSNVKQSMEGAAWSGLTVALYNPVKRDLDEKLREVRNIFSLRGYTEVYLVRDAGRPGESVHSLPLEELSEEFVDMRTILLLPGVSVERVGTLLLDRRGYRAEKETIQGRDQE